MFRLDSENLSCYGEKLIFQDPPGKMIGLLSYPASGNTWVRHLIQKTTGIITGSVYFSTLLYENGFPGEAVYNGSVIVVKSHLNSW